MDQSNTPTLNAFIGKDIYGKERLIFCDKEPITLCGLWVSDNVSHGSVSILKPGTIHKLTGNDMCASDPCIPLIFNDHITFVLNSIIVE